jgi:hypothetical protein
MFTFWFSVAIIAFVCLMYWYSKKVDPIEEDPEMTKALAYTRALYGKKEEKK